MEDTITKSVEIITVDPFEETPPAGFFHVALSFFRMIPAIGFAAGFVASMVFVSAMSLPTKDQIIQTLPTPAPNAMLSPTTPAAQPATVPAFPTPKHQ